MEDTIVYLIRHAETVVENGIRNTDENFQTINEMEILSVEGEEQARDPSREQLAFPKFKTRDGESANDTNKRMNEFIGEILEKYNGKRIAVVSHGGSIKFYLLSYCKVNEGLNLEYEGKELVISSPCLLKMTFRNNELVKLEPIE